MIGPGGLYVTVSGHPDRSPDRPDSPWPGGISAGFPQAPVAVLRQTDRGWEVEGALGSQVSHAPGDARFTVGLADRRVPAITATGSRRRTPEILRTLLSSLRQIRGHQQAAPRSGAAVQ
jgi:hypothetical protein